MQFKSVILIVGLVIISISAEEQYTSRFDTINVDEILKSERLLNNYFKCLMDRGRCTPEASELKKVLPDALETDCMKCTNLHKKMARKVIDYIVKNKNEMWQELVGKYDPKGTYRTKFEKDAVAAGINIQA
uniref:Chemosensory protein 8 n=1 Tax=Sclerodermus sp. MQW-2015 TaxID=1729718 RepID=A0A0N9JMS5_9HYME|nr:chemosensory protein 8 [Sclerodermus sp. MQW-2015]